LLVVEPNMELSIMI